MFLLWKGKWLRFFLSLIYSLNKEKDKINYIKKENAQSSINIRLLKIFLFCNTKNRQKLKAKRAISTEKINLSKHYLLDMSLLCNSPYVKAFIKDNNYMPYNHTVLQLFNRLILLHCCYNEFVKFPQTRIFKSTTSELG